MATTFTKETKPTWGDGVFSRERDAGYLLKEDTYYLLLETGGRIIIGGAEFSAVSFTREGKPVTLFTKEGKP